MDINDFLLLLTQVDLQAGLELVSIGLGTVAIYLSRKHLNQFHELAKRLLERGGK